MIYEPSGSFDDVFGHRPMNQTPTYGGINLYESDPLLVALSEVVSTAQRAELSQLGRDWGTATSFQLADLANKHKPTLKTHDHFGARIDKVVFHPAYHGLMARSVSAGLQGSIWDEGTSAQDGPVNPYQARAMRFYLASQVECGHLCPLTMTNAAPAALLHNPQLLNEWLPHIRSPHYDPVQAPHSEKKGVTIGMAMTEKQGGTDVRANITRARATQSDLFLINGHKWFMSAPMCDAFLILAQTNQGLSCFFLPRFMPDGTRNNIHLQRLKDKLGNISNASSEVEFHQAGGYLVGAEGHGIRTILDMVTLTRLDCALASAGIMRTALAHAVHHARHRSVFNNKLIDQPIAIRVMADMALDCAAATVLSLRLAEAFDLGSKDRSEALFARLMTPVIKYWVCKAAPAFTMEAMECLGGNGYIEDWPMARFYREAPVNAIWEGSGNVMCLDVLRVLRSNPESLDIVLMRVEAIFGNAGAAMCDVIRKLVKAALQDEGSMRMVCEQLALTVAAAELRRIARTDIADAFLDSRLNKPFRSTYGMLDGRFDARAIVDAMYPAA